MPSKDAQHHPSSVRKGGSMTLAMCLISRGTDKEETLVNAHQLLPMSMKGETCRALGTLSPSGLKAKVTEAAQGVF